MILRRFRSFSLVALFLVPALASACGSSADPAATDPGTDAAVDAPIEDPTDASSPDATPDGGPQDAGTDAPPSAFSVASTAVGDHTSCAISPEGALKCWGLFGLSKIGDAPGEMATLLPFPLGAGTGVASLAAGELAWCAVLVGGSLKCWGFNDHGQLGLGNTSYQAGPSPFAAIPTVPVGGVKQVSMSTHTCAILLNGALKCWGNNEFWQLGYGDNVDRGTMPGQVAALAAIDLGVGRTALQVGVGKEHTCALLDDGTVKCWGGNQAGQLGYGSTTSLGDNRNEMGANLPAIELGPGRTATALSVGGEHTCVLLDDRSIKCWGRNTCGAVGDGSSLPRGDLPNEMGANLPAVALPAGRSALAVRAAPAGLGHTCALLDDGSVTCWGCNMQGQLGIGSTTTMSNVASEACAASGPAATPGAGSAAAGAPTTNIATTATLATMAGSRLTVRPSRRSFGRAPRGGRLGKRPDISRHYAWLRRCPPAGWRPRRGGRAPLGRRGPTGRRWRR